MAPVPGSVDWGLLVLVLVLVVVLDLLFSLGPEEAKRSSGIDYENEDDDEDDWETRESP